MTSPGFLIAITDHDDPFEMLTRLQSDSGLKAIKKLTVPLPNTHEPHAAHAALKIIETLTVISKACTNIPRDSMKDRVSSALTFFSSSPFMYQHTAQFH
jgi:hypothetical protein